MKIEKNGSEYLSRIRSEQTEDSKGNERASRASKGTSLESQDKAALSDRAKLLAKARIAADEVPESRNDMVEALRTRIESGEYEVPYEALAERLEKLFKES